MRMVIQAVKHFIVWNFPFNVKLIAFSQNGEDERVHKEEPVYLVWLHV